MEDSHPNYSPLLSPQVVQNGYAKTTSVSASATKLILRSLIWVLFIFWLLVFLIYPSQSGNQWVYQIIGIAGGTPFGSTGSIFVIYAAPIILIAFLAIALLLVSGEETLCEKKKSKRPRFRLWTFPVLVDGPLGVVSAAELIGIVIFLFYVVWAIWNYTVQAIEEGSSQPSFKTKWTTVLESLGVHFGTTGICCLAFLFLPISRGSALLRLVDIPFEHATRYHVWLGHLTMVLFTLHGLSFVIKWSIEGNLAEKLDEWSDTKFANRPGVISYIAGFFMWMTSMPPVRKWNFELFYYTHHLYVIFVVFLALHVGDFLFTFAFGAIFLFMLDRFLRFCQSRRTVNVISAKCLPGGTVELVLSKPRSLRYNALSFIFLQIREVSWLQWHPFSVCSSPLDGNYHLSVIIKVLGRWTQKLREKIIEGEALKQSVVKVSVEGPYGHEVPYHLMYEHLILVAGGIGLTPFLAILSDILHRVRDGKPCSPRNILLVWAMRKSDELPLLSTIDMEAICPGYSNKVNIDVHIYVTRESEPPLEEGCVYKPKKSSLCPMPSVCPMSVVVGTGDIVWSGLYMFSSTVGFLILLGLLDIFYINPSGIEAWWYKGLLLIVCMVASVIIFGGLVVALWLRWEKQSYTSENSDDAKVIEQNVTAALEDPSPQNGTNSFVTRYGSRPDFKEIFEGVSEKWGHVDVGVIVCGPPALESGVAQEIRSHTITKQRHHHPIFHFHTHSFDL
ncbi:ferric reduction oxidase 7, chloroplastic-like [Senna tora]|uniref:ferric-chelate reductase (NADH) n=1 Tax=Senna tora TaxID=362788 RepID=A0A834VX80_9FABA|nr:ferric reduction oxidase 7, chloroplastic-like [Senna tora]